MPNPYAPTRLPITDEERADRDKAMFVGRLRQLGLDEDGIKDVEDHWDDFDGEDWTPDARRMLARAPDRVLREAIRNRNAEFTESTLTVEEQDVAELEAAVERAESEASDKMGGTVPEILEWVGDDRARAMAVSNLERGPEGGSRKTLTEALDRIIDGS